MDKKWFLLFEHQTINALIQSVIIFCIPFSVFLNSFHTISKHLKRNSKYKKKWHLLGIIDRKGYSNRGARTFNLNKTSCITYYYYFLFYWKEYIMYGIWYLPNRRRGFVELQVSGRFSFWWTKSDSISLIAFDI